MCEVQGKKKESGIPSWEYTHIASIIVITIFINIIFIIAL